MEQIPPQWALRRKSTPRTHPTLDNIRTVYFVDLTLVVIIWSQFQTLSIIDNVIGPSDALKWFEICQV